MYANESSSTLNFDDGNLISYRLCRDSGTLDFWDEPGEDIYTGEDGEPINE